MMDAADMSWKPVSMDEVRGYMQMERESDSGDNPLLPPPYDWDMAREVAKVITEMMQSLSKSWQDEIESHEKEWPMDKIRLMQGVGIVLDSILYTFRTNMHSFSQASDEAAATQAFYYLEDF